VARWLKSSNTDENAATWLIRCALQDEKGVHHLSRMLTLSSNESRMYRDDITIQVIFFNGVEKNKLFNKYCCASLVSCESLSDSVSSISQTLNLRKWDFRNHSRKLLCKS
jgi:hypothetical protein